MTGRGVDADGTAMTVRDMLSTVTVEASAARIGSGRISSLASGDPDRASRAAAAHLPWLAMLEDRDRARCLDEVVAAARNGGDIGGVLSRWTNQLTN